MFKRLLLLACVITSASAQIITLSGPATAKAGQTINLTLTALTAGQPNTTAAALQWNVGYPAGGYTASVSTGVTSKAVSCTPDNQFCLLTGMNTTVIANGAVATYALKIPASAAPGPVTVPLSKLVGVDGTGSGGPLVSGPMYGFSISDPRDLNGDTKVDAVDVQLMIAEVVAAQANPAACVDDQTGDSKCDLLDVMKIIVKALGLVP